MGRISHKRPTRGGGISGKIRKRRQKTRHRRRHGGSATTHCEQLLGIAQGEVARRGHERDGLLEQVRRQETELNLLQQRWSQWLQQLGRFKSMEELTKYIHELRRSNATSHRTIQRLQDRVESLERIERARGQVGGGFEAEIARLERELQNCHTELRRLAEEVARHEQSNLTLQEHNLARQEENERLTEEVARHEQSNLTLQEHNLARQEENERLQEELRRIRGDNRPQ